MSPQPFRLPSGGLIDRGRPLAFDFDGRPYQGYHGDTLASALLANGVNLVARSFKYHRPRGIFGAGAEEPNALVGLRGGARAEPNLRATQIELFDGLEAASQNRWPSLAFDVGAVNGLLSPLLPAGFYYKTFMWPGSWWMAYERIIRHAAGMGRASSAPDPDHYEHCFAHCDVLVAGGGPAGLAAALAAGRAGARVILADETPAFGGGLRGENAVIDDAPALDWVARNLDELAAMTHVTLLPRACVFGYYDHNLLAIVERVADHLVAPPAHAPRQRRWMVRAKQVVLATGSIERSLVFANNDRPGVMLASAARTYVNAFAVRPGRRAVIFTNNDSAYQAAADLAAAGIEVAALVDCRSEPGAAAALAERHGIKVLAGHAVVAARGGKRVAGVEVAALDGSGGLTGPGRQRLDCDLLAVSGGWSPSVHLHAQARGRPRYDPVIAAFVPGDSVQSERSAGAARGTLDLAACLRDGLAAGTAAAREAGFAAATQPPAPDCPEAPQSPIRPLWLVPSPPGRHGKKFVDLQNDVTAADVGLAAREGYVSVEHVKRYTTLGMGTDQGRTSNVAGLAILADLRETDIPSIGTTTFRPPYTPVTIGAFASGETGTSFAPLRRTAMHAWHQAAGAPFVAAGLWHRPQAYPRAGESLTQAIRREALAVRRGVGLVDVSTLGKIDIQGPDAAELLNRVYINAWSKLAVGRCRYGVMLRDDGMVLDDGTTSRLAEQRYLMTTTTAEAGPVLQHLEYLLQVVWPELDVQVVSVTEEWTAMALAGPDSRKVLARVVEGLDICNEALPYMAVGQGKVAGVPARIYRISFSGELGYEINVPADHGLAVWQALLAAGEDLAMVPYGTEAMGVLRIEKGHVVGGEINGRTTADDLGFGRMLSTRKDFIGKRALNRPGLQAADRKQLVGLVPADGATPIPRGGQLVVDPEHALPNPMEGEVTSQCYSPTLEKPIGLGLLRRGRARLGETLHACSPVTNESVPVTVTSPVFVDPEGERLRV